MQSHSCFIGNALSDSLLDGLLLSLELDVLATDVNEGLPVPSPIVKDTEEGVD